MALVEGDGMLRLLLEGGPQWSAFADVHDALEILEDQTSAVGNTNGRHLLRNVQSNKSSTNRNVNETPALRNLERRRLDRGTIGSSVRTTILKCPRRHDTPGWLR